MSNQVTDSGHPPLSSICVVDISVAEQSKHPPSVVPLEVFISTSGGLFPSQGIGRLHASDQDLQDVLTYKLVSESPAGGRFSIDPADGKIWADGSLEEDFYSLNVSVADGRFTVWTGVRVHVWAAEQRLLDSGVSLQLLGLSAEEFLGDHWRGLQRSLGQALGLPRQEVHLASLQQLQDSRDLEVLLVWRSPAGPAQPLLPNRLAGEPRQDPIKSLKFRGLTDSRSASSSNAGVLSDIEDSLGLSILRVKHNGCLGAGCPPRGCRNAIRLTGELRSHFTTARASYLTPHHSWESVCPCNGGWPQRVGGGGVIARLTDSSSACPALQKVQ